MRYMSVLNQVFSPTRAVTDAHCLFALSVWFGVSKCVFFNNAGHFNFVSGLDLECLATHPIVTNRPESAG